MRARSNAEQQARQTRAAGAPARAATPTAPPPPPGIKIPDEITAGSNAAPSEIQFPMTGAQVFARACKEEGVAALFCCPGNYGVIHAIAGTGIPTYSGRHEGSMTHAADAFIRVTGELAVASGTEGPGFTDMICGIACANAARTPLLVVASNMALFQEDTESGIQLAYQQPTTDGMKTMRGERGRRPARPRRCRFQENVRYDKVGEALGAHGEYVTRPGDFRPALERAWQVAVKESRPSVINCQGKKEFWMRDTYPPGMLGKIEPGCMSYYH